jgi:Protein of unknown function (DUF2789)
METGAHNLSNLFLQLGLAGDANAVDSFLATHSLRPGQHLSDAPFWNPSQASFLRDAITHDADWSEAADELASRLLGK